MAIIQTSVSAIGPSATLSLPMGLGNWYPAGGFSFLVNFSGNGVGIPGIADAVGTVTVQVSNDPLANPNNSATDQANARWNNHDILVGLTTDKNSSVVYPCAYARIYCTAYTSGTVTMQIGWMDASQPR